MKYSIEGEPLPVVICNLENNETMITESGAMSWMSPNMKMETTSGGGLGKVFGGEGIFNTVVSGSGHVWIQTMPVAQMANVLRPYFPSTNH